MTFDVTLSWGVLGALVGVVLGAGYLLWRLSKRPPSGSRFEEFD
jgi:hypothetical protein